jgi:D-cysteine desulfhydrase
VRGGLELAEQIAASGQDFAAVVLASGSAGTHAGLALALESARPGTRVIGVTVSRSEAAQKPKIEGLLHHTAELLEVEVPRGLNLELWDAYFAPRYGEANAAGLEAISLLARLEAILLDPVYTGKAFAGLLDGLQRGAFPGNGPLLFLHTGGSPALFAYKQK